MDGVKLGSSEPRGTTPTAPDADLSDTTYRAGPLPGQPPGPANLASAEPRSRLRNGQTTLLPPQAIRRTVYHVLSVSEWRHQRSFIS